VSIGDLKANQSAVITVPAQLAATQSGQCLTNTVFAKSAAAKPEEVKATSDVCISASPSPTPSPTPTPTPTPTPSATPTPAPVTLPRTGAESALVIPALMGGVAGLAARMGAKRRALRDGLRRNGQ